MHTEAPARRFARFKKQWAPFVLWYMALAVTLCVLLWSNNTGIDTAKRLMREPGQTTAMVMVLNCNSHSIVRYAFTAGGRRYQADGPAPDCDQLQVGDQLRVYYVKSDPGLSTLDTPEGIYANEIYFIIFCSVIGPLQILWIWHKMVRRR